MTLYSGVKYWQYPTKQLQCLKISTSTHKTVNTNYFTQLKYSQKIAIHKYDILIYMYSLKKFYILPSHLGNLSKQNSLIRVTERKKKDPLGFLQVPVSIHRLKSIIHASTRREHQSVWTIFPNSSGIISWTRRLYIMVTRFVFTWDEDVHVITVKEIWWNILKVWIYTHVKVSHTSLENLPFSFKKHMNEDDKIQSLWGTQSLEHGDMFSFTSRHFECEPVWHYFFSPFEFFRFVINWCCSSFAAPGLLLWSLQ